MRLMRVTGGSVTEAGVLPVNELAAVPAADDSRLPVTQKAAYGVGSLADFFLANVLQRLASPIYVIAMKLDPGVMGIILAAARVLGTGCDPVGSFLSKTCQGSGISLLLLWRYPLTRHRAMNIRRLIEARRDAASALASATPTERADGI